MHEIEVKAVLRDKEGVMRSMRERGWSFSAPVEEDDRLFAKDVASLDAYNRNADFLRIRTRSDGTSVFTLKHHPDRHEGRPDSMPLEHETGIDSPEEIEKMLLVLGYEETVRVKKTRQKGKLGRWEACVDEVEGLGSFIELEELAGPDDAARIVAEMKAFFAGLGIDEKDMMADRYDIGLLKKRFAA